MPTVTVLVGRRVRLDPLSSADLDDLVAAASVDRATYGWTSVPDGRDAMAGWIEERLGEQAAGREEPFVQRTPDGTVVGATRYLHLRPHAVEVGGTWLSAPVQRSGLNREAKLLLLTEAFDVRGLHRVDLCTDARNERSRTAIAGIGATFEGVLRSWQPSHAAGESGLFRDTAIFSITRPEWPAVRDRLASLVG